MLRFGWTISHSSYLNRLSVLLIAPPFHSPSQPDLQSGSSRQPCPQSCCRRRCCACRSHVCTAAAAVQPALPLDTILDFCSFSFAVQLTSPAGHLFLPQAPRPRCLRRHHQCHHSGNLSQLPLLRPPIKSSSGLAGSTPSLIADHSECDPHAAWVAVTPAVATASAATDSRRHSSTPTPASLSMPCLSRST